MALNQSYELYDLLHDRFGGKKDYYRMSEFEKKYLKMLSIKRDDKSLRRVADIKLYTLWSFFICHKTTNERIII